MKIKILKDICLRYFVYLHHGTAKKTVTSNVKKLKTTIN